MAEYIDKTKLIADGWFLNRTYQQGAHTMVYESKEIADIPAADVAPVVHGRWIKARGSWFTPGGDPVWECSECGKGMHVYGVEHGSYGADVADGQWVACPNCGAKMDEVADNG